MWVAIWWFHSFLRLVLHGELEKIGLLFKEFSSTNVGTKAPLRPNGFL
jgi:hypothetical protein